MHSRRRTSECLSVTACSMDEYAEEKRTEENLIVRSGISEVETTNNKRLRSTVCIEAIQTKASRGLFATAELLVFFSAVACQMRDCSRSLIGCHAFRNAQSHKHVVYLGHGTRNTSSKLLRSIYERHRRQL